MLYSLELTMPRRGLSRHLLEGRDTAAVQARREAGSAPTPERLGFLAARPSAARVTPRARRH